MKRTAVLILCLILLYTNCRCFAAETDQYTNIGDAGTVLIGDTDLNGEIESIDVTVLQRFLAYVYDSLPNETAANIDLDDTIDIIDATMIQRYLAEIDFLFSCNINTPDYVAYEGKRVVDLVASRQNNNTVSFPVFTDAHYSEESQTIIDGITHAGMGMNIVTSLTAQDFGAVLGDNGWQSSDVSLEEGLSQIKTCNDLIDYSLDSIPNLRVPGNHCSQIGAYYTNRNYHLNADLFPLYGAYNTGAVFDGENQRRGYCYRDFDDKKLRVICLNTSDLEEIKPADYESHNISSVQLKWLCSALDVSKKKNPERWQILVMSHAPLDWCDRTIPAAGILHAYDTGSAYSVSKDGETIACDFGSVRRGTIIAQIHGHIHDFLVDDLRCADENDNTVHTSIKRIAVPNACPGRTNEYLRFPYYYRDIDFSESTTYNMYAETAEDTSFCVFTIDLNQRRIYADHYGAGIDRIIDY